jgi:hypothetical protein
MTEGSVVTSPNRTLTGPGLSGLAGPSGSGVAARAGGGGAASDVRKTTGGTPATAVIACGAITGHVREIVTRRGWELRVHSLPAILHNSPRDIAPAVERLAGELQAGGWRVIIAYADCGTYGELDALCERLGVVRLPGLHCYDVLAGPDRIRAVLEAEPGTYLLSDFLVRSFRKSVLESLGLDRYPELMADYFGHYQRVVWLAQEPDGELTLAAHEVGRTLGLPLTIIEVGVSRLEAALAELAGQAATL